MKLEELRKIAARDPYELSTNHIDALLKIAEAAKKAQEKYLSRHDWFDYLFDSELDEALKELENVE